MLCTHLINLHIHKRDEIFALTWPSRYLLLSDNVCTRKNKNQFNERERFKDFPRPVTQEVPFAFQGQAKSDIFPLIVSYTLGKS